MLRRSPSSRRAPTASASPPSTRMRRLKACASVRPSPMRAPLSRPCHPAGRSAPRPQWASAPGTLVRPLRTQPQYRWRRRVVDRHHRCRASLRRRRKAPVRSHRQAVALQADGARRPCRHARRRARTRPLRAITSAGRGRPRRGAPFRPPHRSLAPRAGNRAAVKAPRSAPHRRALSPAARRPAAPLPLGQGRRSRTHASRSGVGRAGRAAPATHRAAGAVRAALVARSAHLG